MIRNPSSVLITAALLLVSCGRLTGTPEDSPAPTTASASASASQVTVGSAGTLDLDVLREALVGPSPVPSVWEAEVDEIMGVIEEALDTSLPAVDALSAREATCATWQPLVGNLFWMTGAIVERQVAVAHLGQLAEVATDEIRPAVQDAFRVVSAAAAAQLTPDGDSDVMSTAPRDELREIGRWALKHCDIEIVAESDPNTEDWTEEDFELSCQLDRSALEDSMEEYRDGAGDGRYASHPHELEISLEYFIYPGWHRIASVDNDATPPTFEVEPIRGAFCDR